MKTDTLINYIIVWMENWGINLYMYVCGDSVVKTLGVKYGNELFKLASMDI